MKNLKKALSLVLASAMLFGMMVVGTGAAYADVKAEHNEEAIAVVAAAGIMGAGDSFNPDGELTRGEMAVIMVNMLGLDTKDFKGAANFTDAGWAADYIDACYANGIMAGVSATEFGTNVKVTTAQAALMMLKALGYFEVAQLNDWMLDTIKMASKINLLDGIDAKANAVLTRNEVAQLALNALKATVIEETANGANTSIKGEGFEIIVDANVTRTNAPVKTSGGAQVSYTATPDGKLQLVEDLFGNDLKLVTISGGDDFGRPAHKWTFKSNGKTEDVITVADEADYILVADKAYADVVALYKDKVDEKYAGTAGTEYINGRGWNAGTDKTGANWMANGDVVEIFMNADETAIAYSITTRYSIAKIDDISTALTKAQKEDGNTVKVDLKLGTSSIATDILDTKFAGFDAETYTEGAYILYVLKSGEIIDSKIAETVEGKVSSIKGTKATIDGTAYGIATTVNVNDEGTFYLNEAGAVMYKVAKSEKSDNYAFIYTVKKASGLNADGINGDTYTAYMVKADGSKASYVVDADSIYTGTGSTTNKIDVTSFSTGANAQTLLVAYSINEDGKLVIETPTDAPVAITSNRSNINKDTVTIRVASGSTPALYATTNTQFIFMDNATDSTKMDVKVATSYKNVQVAGSTSRYAIVDEDGYALYVFVPAANGALASDALLAVLVDADPVKTTVDNVNYFAYNVIADGAETVLTFKTTDQLSGMMIGTAFEYKMDGEYVKASSVSTSNITRATVSVVNDDYVILSNGKQFDNGSETLFTITAEYDVTSAPTVGTTVPEAVAVSVGGGYDVGDVVYYTVDADTDVDTVFVVDVIW